MFNVILYGMIYSYLSRDVVIFYDDMCTVSHVMRRCCHKLSRNSDISYVNLHYNGQFHRYDYIFIKYIS